MYSWGEKERKTTKGSSRTGGPRGPSQVITHEVGSAFDALMGA